jgi:hypothetical protein
LKNAERMERLSRKLAAVLAGTEKPADDAERVALAQLCAQPYQRRYAACARLWREVFRNQPALADDLKTSNRYNAACAAALVGCGAGADAARLEAKEKARLRSLALTWMRADFAAWLEQAQSDKPQERAAARRQLQWWPQDPDLAGIRDSPALANLPAAERDAWCKLWAEVAAVHNATQTAP